MIAATSAAPPAKAPALRDIHVPPAPSWWPPAPGWWIVIVLLLLTAAMGIWLWRRQRRRRVLERAMLAEVDALVVRHSKQPQKLAAGLHQLLRRGALRLDAEAARRRGEAWRQTLAKVAVDASTLDQLMTLESAMYRPDAPFDALVATTATRRWLVLAWRFRGARASTSLPPIAEASPESGHA